MNFPNIEYWFSWNALIVFLPTLFWAVVSVYGLWGYLKTQPKLFWLLMVIGCTFSLLSWWKISIDEQKQDLRDFELRSIPFKTIEELKKSTSATLISDDNLDISYVENNKFIIRVVYRLDSPLKNPEKIIFQGESPYLEKIEVKPVEQSSYISIAGPEGPNLKSAGIRNPTAKEYYVFLTLTHEDKPHLRYQIYM